VGAKAPHHIHSTNEVGGYKSEACFRVIELSRESRLLGQMSLRGILFGDQRFQEINPEATDEVGGNSLDVSK